MSIRIPRLRQIVTREWVCPSCRAHRLNTSQRPFSTTSQARQSSLRAAGYHRTRHTIKSRRTFSNTSATRAAPKRQPILPDYPARTRFAPSPTGYLHIGGLRTAIFSFLLAKRTGGQFLLRIEDTDQKRLVPDAEAKLISDLQWAGIQWDEGPGLGPYRQSARTQYYQQHASHLLDEESAYRCFCTPQTANSASNVYVSSGCYQGCSALPREESRQRGENGEELFTIRLKTPADAHKRVYPDLVYGRIQRLKRSPAAPLTGAEGDTSIDASDTILLKSDGTPTYHFANVVDDHLMKITHVIRGAEWMASTPLHYDIYQAFGWTPPQFAHVGLLVDQNQAKLSKRSTDFAFDVASMRDRYGVFPGTLNNFLALLGWSNPTDNDVMDMEQLIQNFDLKFTRGNTMVRIEKLGYLQRQHVARLCTQFEEDRNIEPMKPVLTQIFGEVSAKYPDTTIIGPKLRSEPDEPHIELLIHIGRLLQADSKSFLNAAHWVNRNRYFFSFDPAQVPAAKDSYNVAQTLTPQVLNEAIHDLFLMDNEGNTLDNEHYFWVPLLRDPHTYPEPTEKERLQSLEAGFHNQIEDVVWMYAQKFRELYPLCDPPEVVPADQRIEDEPLTPETSSEALDFVVGVGGPASQDLYAQARVLLGNGKKEKEVVDEDEVVGLVSRYKVVNGALMKYLREKLAYGLPGPSMSTVMALLGYRECCRRLGVDHSKMNEPAPERPSE